MAGFMNDPLASLGMGLLSGNYGRNSKEAFANAMRGGLLGMQQAGANQSRQAQTQMAQQQLAMQQQQLAIAKKKREAEEAFIASLPPQEQAMARGNPELYRAMMQQKYQQQYAPPQRPTEAPSNIREWQAFQQMSPQEKQQYLSMKRANPFMDTGPALVQRGMYDPTETLAIVPKGLKPGEEPAVRAAQTAASKEAEIKATTQAQAQVDLPGAEMDLALTKDYIKELRNHPGLDSATGVSGAILPVIPGTARADFEARKEQILGGSFLQAYQQLKGGGQITEVEGKKAENAIARMQTAVSKPAFLAALNDYERAIDVGFSKMKIKAGASTTTSGGWSIKKVE